jgi:hypothetical protein
MRKKSTRLALHRDTLRRLNETWLRNAAGGMPPQDLTTPGSTTCNPTDKPTCYTNCITYCGGSFTKP